MSQLTDREKEILTLMAQGLTNKEISKRISIPQSNVSITFSNAREHLGLSHLGRAVKPTIRLQKRLETVELAIKLGLIKADPEPLRIQHSLIASHPLANLAAITLISDQDNSSFMLGVSLFAKVSPSVIARNDRFSQLNILENLRHFVENQPPPEVNIKLIAVILGISAYALIRLWRYLKCEQRQLLVSVIFAFILGLIDPILLWPASILVASCIFLNYAHLYIDPHLIITRCEIYPDALVAKGPYRWTRNPIYISYVIIFSSFITSIIATLFYPMDAKTLTWIIALISGLFVALQTSSSVKKESIKEESYLKDKFGSDYEQYASKVPRWISLGWRSFVLIFILVILMLGTGTILYGAVYGLSEFDLLVILVLPIIVLMLTISWRWLQISGQKIQAYSGWCEHDEAWFNNTQRKKHTLVVFSLTAFTLAIYRGLLSLPMAGWLIIAVFIPTAIAAKSLRRAFWSENSFFPDRGKTMARALILTVGPMLVTYWLYYRWAVTWVAIQSDSTLLIWGLILATSMLVSLFYYIFFSLKQKNNALLLVPFAISAGNLSLISRLNLSSRTGFDMLEKLHYFLWETAPPLIVIGMSVLVGFLIARVAGYIADKKDWGIKTPRLENPLRTFLSAALVFITLGVFIWKIAIQSQIFGLFSNFYLALFGLMLGSWFSNFWEEIVYKYNRDYIPFGFGGWTNIADLFIIIGKFVFLRLLGREAGGFFGLSSELGQGLGLCFFVFSIARIRFGAYVYKEFWNEVQSRLIEMPDGGAIVLPRSQRIIRLQKINSALKIIEHILWIAFVIFALMQVLRIAIWPGWASLGITSSVAGGDFFGLGQGFITGVMLSSNELFGYFTEQKQQAGNSSTGTIIGVYPIGALNIAMFYHAKADVIIVQEGSRSAEQLNGPVRGLYLEVDGEIQKITVDRASISLTEASSSRHLPDVVFVAPHTDKILTSFMDELVELLEVMAGQGYFAIEGDVQLLVPKFILLSNGIYYKEFIDTLFKRICASKQLKTLSDETKTSIAGCVIRGIVGQSGRREEREIDGVPTMVYIPGKKGKVILAAAGLGINNIAQRRRVKEILEERDYPAIIPEDAGKNADSIWHEWVKAMVTMAVNVVPLANLFKEDGLLRRIEELWVGMVLDPESPLYPKALEAVQLTFETGKAIGVFKEQDCEQIWQSLEEDLRKRNKTYPSSSVQRLFAFIHAGRIPAELPALEKTLLDTLGAMARNIEDESLVLKVRSLRDDINANLNCLRYTESNWSPLSGNVILSDKPDLPEAINKCPLPARKKVAVFEVVENDYMVFAGNVVEALRLNGNEIRVYRLNSAKALGDILGDYRPDFIMMPYSPENRELVTEYRAEVYPDVYTFYYESFEYPSYVNLVFTFGKKIADRVKKAVGKHKSQTRRTEYVKITHWVMKHAATLGKRYGLIPERDAVDYEYAHSFVVGRIKNGERVLADSQQPHAIVFEGEKAPEGFIPIRITRRIPLIFTSPHPDDMEIAAGGMAIAGAENEVIMINMVFSAGEAGIILNDVDRARPHVDEKSLKIKIRGEEARNAGVVLSGEREGAVIVENLNIIPDIPSPDVMPSREELIEAAGKLKIRFQEFIKAYQDAIREEGQFVVIMPHREDGHPTHNVVTDMILSVLTDLSSESEGLKDVEIIVLYYLAPWAGGFNFYFYSRDNVTMKGLVPDADKIEAASYQKKALAHIGPELAGGFGKKSPSTEEMGGDFVERFIGEGPGSGFDIDSVRKNIIERLKVSERTKRDTHGPGSSMSMPMFLLFNFTLQQRWNVKLEIASPLLLLAMTVVVLLLIAYLIYKSGILKYLARMFHSPPLAATVKFLLRKIVARGPKLVTLDGDGTLYKQGGSVLKKGLLAALIVILLMFRINVAVVTALSHPDEPHKYRQKFQGIIDMMMKVFPDYPERKDIGKFYIMGGQCNYLYRIDREGRIEEIPKEEWDPSGKTRWDKRSVRRILDIAQEALEESVKRLSVGATIIRKELAVGMVPKGRVAGSLLEYIALEVTERVNKHSARKKHALPFVAFSSSHDVFVDIGNKAIGIRLLAQYLDVRVGEDGFVEEACHFGDGFGKAGNDVKAEEACTCLRVKNPGETRHLLTLLVLLVIWKTFRDFFTHKAHKAREPSRIDELKEIVLRGDLGSEERMDAVKALGDIYTKESAEALEELKKKLQRRNKKLLSSIKEELAIWKMPFHGIEGSGERVRGDKVFRQEIIQLDVGSFEVHIGGPVGQMNGGHSNKKVIIHIPGYGALEFFAWGNVKVKEIMDPSLKGDFVLWHPHSGARELAEETIVITIGCYKDRYIDAGRYTYGQNQIEKIIPLLEEILDFPFLLNRDIVLFGISIGSLVVGSLYKDLPQYPHIAERISEVMLGAPALNGLSTLGTTWMKGLGQALFWRLMGLSKKWFWFEGEAPEEDLTILLQSLDDSEFLKEVQEGMYKAKRDNPGLPHITLICAASSNSAIFNWLNKDFPFLDFEDLRILGCGRSGGLGDGMVNPDAFERLPENEEARGFLEGIRVVRIKGDITHEDLKMDAMKRVFMRIVMEELGFCDAEDLGYAVTAYNALEHMEELKQEGERYKEELGIEDFEEEQRRAGRRLMWRVKFSPLAIIIGSAALVNVAKWLRRKTKDATYVCATTLGLGFSSAEILQFGSPSGGGSLSNIRSIVFWIIVVVVLYWIIFKRKRGYLIKEKYLKVTYTHDKVLDLLWGGDSVIAFDYDSDDPDHNLVSRVDESNWVVWARRKGCNIWWVRPSWSRLDIMDYGLLGLRDFEGIFSSVNELPNIRRQVVLTFCLDYFTNRKWPKGRRDKRKKREKKKPSSKNIAREIDHIFSVLDKKGISVRMVHLAISPKYAYERYKEHVIEALRENITKYIPLVIPFAPFVDFSSYEVSDIIQWLSILQMVSAIVAVIIFVWLIVFSLRSWWLSRRMPTEDAIRELGAAYRMRNSIKVEKFLAKAAELEERAKEQDEEVERLERQAFEYDRKNDYSMADLRRRQAESLRNHAEENREQAERNREIAGMIVKSWHTGPNVPEGVKADIKEILDFLSKESAKETRQRRYLLIALGVAVLIYLGLGAIINLLQVDEAISKMFVMSGVYGFVFFVMTTTSFAGTPKRAHSSVMSREIAQIEENINNIRLLFDSEKERNEINPQIQVFISRIKRDGKLLFDNERAMRISRFQRLEIKLDTLQALITMRKRETQHHSYLFNSYQIFTIISNKRSKEDVLSLVDVLQERKVAKGAHIAMIARSSRSEEKILDVIEMLRRKGIVNNAYIAQIIASRRSKDEISRLIDKLEDKGIIEGTHIAQIIRSGRSENDILSLIVALRAKEITGLTHIAKIINTERSRDKILNLIDKLKVEEITESAHVALIICSSRSEDEIWTVINVLKENGITETTHIAQIMRSRRSETEILSLIDKLEDKGIIEGAHIAKIISTKRSEDEILRLITALRAKEIAECAHIAYIIGSSRAEDKILRLIEQLKGNKGVTGSVHIAQIIKSSRSEVEILRLINMLRNRGIEEDSCLAKIIRSGRPEKEIVHYAKAVEIFKNSDFDFEISDSWIAKVIINPEEVTVGFQNMLAGSAALPILDLSQLLTEADKLHIKLRLILRGLNKNSLYALSEIFLDRPEAKTLQRHISDRITEDEERLESFLEQIGDRSYIEWTEKNCMESGILLLSLSRSIRSKVSKELIKAHLPFVHKFRSDMRRLVAEDKLIFASRHFNLFYFLLKDQVRVASFRAYLKSSIRYFIVEAIALRQEYGPFPKDGDRLVLLNSKRDGAFDPMFDTADLCLVIEYEIERLEFALDRKPRIDEIIDAVGNNGYEYTTHDVQEFLEICSLGQRETLDYLSGFSMFFMSFFDIHQILHRYVENHSPSLTSGTEAITALLIIFLIALLIYAGIHTIKFFKSERNNINPPEDPEVAPVAASWCP